LPSPLCQPGPGRLSTPRGDRFLPWFGRSDYFRLLLSTLPMDQVKPDAAK
jgi:hypothetical protein